MSTEEQEVISEYDDELVHKYSTFAESAYMSNKQRQEFVDKRGINNATYLEDLSTNEIAVYGLPEKEIVMAVRGTKIGMKDLATDAVLAVDMTKITPRYKRAEKKYEEVKNKYKGYKVNLTGHSLGGKIATEIAKQYEDAESHSFNEGSSYITSARARNALAKHPKLEKQKKRIKHYHITGDFISSSLDPSISQIVVRKNPDIKRGAFYQHTIGQFNQARIR